MVLTKEFAAMPVDRQEILRYAMCRQADEATQQLLTQCLAEALPQLSYRVCWTEVAVSVAGHVCRLGEMELTSRTLAKHLTDCDRAVIFAATVGLGLDRLIARYGLTSPAKGLLLQAIGTERIEALCDAFCAELEGGKARFSPGYGDLKLVTQQEIFGLLQCHKHIGLSLKDSLIMSPSKSVTAIVGIT